jgi:hypothetical protein
MERVESPLADVLRDVVEKKTKKIPKRQTTQYGSLRHRLGTVRNEAEFEFLVSDLLRSVGDIEVMGPGAKLDDYSVADMVIWNKSKRSPLFRFGNPIIVECKARAAQPEDVQQVTNYMNRTKGHVALLFHLGQEVGKRKIPPTKEWNGGTVFVIPVTDDMITSPSRLRDQIVELVSTVDQ